MTIYLDMDGTIADLYSVNNWLEDLRAEKVRPYAEAKPLVNLSRLARYIHKAQAKGYSVGIISWLSKTGSIAYDEAVTEAKLKWLSTHLPSVKWNEIHIVKYGTPKSTCRNDEGFLLDDEEKNLTEWGKGAIPAESIFDFFGSL